MILNKDSSVTVVITSFNRFDLLERMIDSLNRVENYPFKDVIIIEDSANEGMHQNLKNAYEGKYTLILNEKNIGAYASIDLAYSFVTTPWVLHIEDDWEFTHGMFVGKSIEVLKHDNMIMQVSLEHNPVMSTLLQVHIANGVEYKIVGTDVNGWWHGFTCHPSVRSMEGYERTKPWTQWSTDEEELSHRELKVGLEYYRLGYKAAILKESYCIHTGLGRCTWHPNV
jgi:hypothetical protein